MIGLAAAALTLSACAGPKYLNEDYSKYDPSLSKAMNLALLTELTTPEGPLKDSKPVQAAQNAGDDPTHTLTAASSAALLVAQSTGAMLDAGMGIGGSMGMSGLGLLLASRQVFTYQPVFSTIIFSWMPTTLAKDKVAAAMLILNILHKETEVKLKSMGAEIILSEVTEPNFIVSEHYAKIEYKINNRIYRTGMKVGEPYVVDFAPFQSNPTNYYHWSYQTKSDDRTPTIVYGTNRLNDKHGYIKKDAEDQATETDLFISVMKALPSYCYTYIAPDLNAKLAPYFLNKGKQLQFIKPTAIK